jgi:1,2-phenylacetyl-CoA epoxidase catalytic subunit
MNGPDFVAEMTMTLWDLLSVRDRALEGLKEAVTRADIPQLLRGALRAEMDAAEIAAQWMSSTPELEARLALARQAGDEAKHYMLIERRLATLGHDLAGFAPHLGERSKLFRYLGTLESTVERIAAAQFTREAIGYKSNELFIAFCEQAGDTATARLYRDEIQPDEKSHHEWGKRLLEVLADSPATQLKARNAIIRTLDLAEELRSVAAGHLLVETLPGC